MIIFENEGEIDIRAAITFGVNVKESENPIGFFGTGLKYAIAVLLRTGHKIAINSGETTYTFDRCPHLIRGKEFRLVCMRENDGVLAELGFTDDLGPTWESWMAYRELWCNARDEGGRAYHVPNVDGDTFAPRSGYTEIIVSGPDIDEVHERRADFIIDGETPAYKIGDVEVYRGRPRGIFYRGMRVAKQIGDMPLRFTYNILCDIALTEDRTAKSGWELEWEIKRAVLAEAPEELAAEIITAQEGEAKFDFSSSVTKPAAGFMEAIKNCSRSEIGNINGSAMKVFKQNAAKNPELVPARMSERQLSILSGAIAFCQRAGFRVTKYEIQVIEGLGENILGCAQGGRILISADCFERGPQWVRMALIEEFVHLEYHVADCTREMQTRFLMEIERVAGMAVAEAGAAA